VISDPDELLFADEAQHPTKEPEPAWAPPATKDAPQISELERAQIEAPPRVVTRAVRPNAQRWLFAKCPDCESKNHVDAVLCGCCGAEIPPAIPADGIGCSKRGQGVARERLELDPDLVPEHLRERWAEEAEEQAERVAARGERYRWRRWSVSVGSATFFGVFLTGIATAFYLIVADTALDGHFSVAAVVGLLLGALAGRETFRRGGGHVEGTVIYGAAAFVAIGVLIGAGGWRVFQTGDSTLTSSLSAAMFIFPAVFLLASSILGSLMGLTIGLQNFDD
jgi:hypothetical protein